MDRQKESGLGVRSFCSNECIAPSTFYYWQKKFRKGATGGRFIPLFVQALGSVAYPASVQNRSTGMDNAPICCPYPTKRYHFG
jgi:hypothetical protein